MMKNICCLFTLHTLLRDESDCGCKVISKIGRPAFYPIFNYENIGDKESMKISLMVGGILLIMGGVIGHNVGANVISQASTISNPSGGNIICDVVAGNDCLPLILAEKTFEFGTLGLGFIGFLLVIYGLLKNARMENNSQVIHTNSPADIILNMLS
jgi:hypothetical protein